MDCSLFIAFVCTLLGAACVDLNKYDESLGYLNWANMNLCKLEQDDDEEICCSGVNCFMNVVLGTQFQLYRVKFSTNRLEEAAFHMRGILEVKEKMLKEGCIELGEANMNVCYVYSAAMNLREALPFCLKALEIRTKHLGCNSVEVAETRGFLGWIYNGLEENEKGIAQKELSESVVKEMTCDSIDSLIEFGRYEEAVGVLKDVVSRDDLEEDKRASAFVSMATAFYELGNFADAKKCMTIALGILEKKGMNQIYVAVLFVENAKDVMDATIGPHHVYSLKTSQILSTSYAEMGSYDLAIEIQEKVVEGLKCLRASEQEFLKEAVIYLDKMKERVAESPASSSPESKHDVKVLSESMSKCAISDDGKKINCFWLFSGSI